MRGFRCFWCLLICLWCCSGCVRLPGEERTLAVVLGVDRPSSEQWSVSVRVPSYQEEGSYQTITAQANALDAALVRLDALAPMKLDYGQLRLIVFHEAAAGSRDFPAALHALATREGLRLDAQLAVTDASVEMLLDHMLPKTGTRLSKSLDVLLESLQDQGAVPDMRLGSAVRLEERQGLLTPYVYLESDQYRFGGAALFGFDTRLSGSLTPGETQLLTLVTGQKKKGPLLLASGLVELTSFSCSPKLSNDAVECFARAGVLRSTLPDEDVQGALTAGLAELSEKLRSASCDAFGLARQTVCLAPDLPAWRAGEWPERCLQLPWRVEVTLTSPIR